MYPHERSLVQDLADQGFAIVGVNSDESLEVAQKAVKDNDLSWQSFFDGGSTNGPIATAWGVRGWPTVYVLDAAGVIRGKNLRGENLEAKVRELLAEMHQ